MKQEVEKCICYCINSINGKSNKEEQEFVKTALKDLAIDPYKGARPGIGKMGSWLRDNPERLLKSYMDENGITHSLNRKDVLFLFFDSNNVSPEKMYGYCRMIEDDITYNHVLEHIVENLVALDEIETARKYSEYFRPTQIFRPADNKEKGYRAILRYYARKPDAKEFFKILKLSQAGKKRHEIEEAKRLLVQSIAGNDGIEAAMKLCSHKNIGNKYYQSILIPFVEEGEYNELKKLLSQYPQLKGENNGLYALTGAYENAYHHQKERDDDFEHLFELSLQVDPKVKYGDARLRDWLLFTLGLGSQDNKERYVRCRTAIKNNWLKQELPV